MFHKIKNFLSTQREWWLWTVAVLLLFWFVAQISYLLTGRGPVEDFVGITNSVSPLGAFLLLSLGVAVVKPHIFTDLTHSQNLDQKLPFCFKVKDSCETAFLYVVGLALFWLLR